MNFTKVSIKNKKKQNKSIVSHILFDFKMIFNSRHSQLEFKTNENRKKKEKKCIELTERKEVTIRQILL